MTVDSVHRAITAEAAARRLQRPASLWWRPRGSLAAYYSRSRSGDGRTTRSKRGVEIHSHSDTLLSTPPVHFDDITDATRTHELALCDRCHTAWASGAHVWVPTGHPRYTRAPYGEAVGGSLMRRQFTTWYGMVVVGWLGRGTTALHCTHHVLTHRLKVLSFFFFPPSLAL